MLPIQDKLREQCANMMEVTGEGAFKMDDVEFAKSHIIALYQTLKSTIEHLESVSLQVEAILHSHAASDREFGQEYEKRHNTLTSNADDAPPSALLKQLDDNLRLLTQHKNAR